MQVSVTVEAEARGGVDVEVEWRTRDAVAHHRRDRLVNAQALTRHLNTQRTYTQHKSQNALTH